MESTMVSEMLYAKYKIEYKDDKLPFCASRLTRGGTTDTSIRPLIAKVEEVAAMLHLQRLACSPLLFLW